jgi:hypothetical protein
MKMKYVLLIFGIVLVIGGGLSIYTGYDIIEVERGWTSVIAGTTAATGGVIIIGLALVLRSLDRLRAALEIGGTQPMRRGAKPAREAAEPFIAIPDLPMAPATSPLGDDKLMRAAKSELGGDIKANADIKIDNRRAEPIAPTAEPLADVGTPAPADTREPAKVQPLSRAASAFVTAATRARAEPSPSIDELWRRVAMDVDATKLGIAANVGFPAPNPQADLEKVEETGFAPEPDDWLDRALEGLEPAIAPEPALAAATQLAPPLAPNPVPERISPDQRSKVVARYDAEGTEYVMFADGAIEARTEEGVFRFKSMAELKAFFQT